jgi:hypothetical protein
MRIDRRTLLLHRFQGLIFVLLFLAVIGALAWFSVRFSVEGDWTAGARASLSEPSRNLIGRFEEPVYVVAFLRENEEIRQRVRAIVDRYRRESDLVRLEFVNPDLEPERAREYGVRQEGEVYVRLGDRREKVDRFTEGGISQAMARALRAGEQFVVFTRGHGESNPFGEANHDLGYLGTQLDAHGLQVHRVHPGQDGIPGNTSVLVIAAPRVTWMPGVAALVGDWVETGGNLLWLAEPGDLRGLENLALQLGVIVPDGQVRDVTGRRLGVDDPAMVLVMEYGDDPVSGRIDPVTLFPHTGTVETRAGEFWDMTPFLRTMPDAWLENRAGDPVAQGPFHLGVQLTRKRPGDEGEQRIAVIANNHFLSNAFIANGANVELGLNLFNWLAEDDIQLDVRTRGAPDRELALSRTQYTVIGSFFLLVLPGLFLLAGGTIWWVRRRR